MRLASQHERPDCIYYRICHDPKLLRQQILMGLYHAMTFSLVIGSTAETIKERESVANVFRQHHIPERFCKLRIAGTSEEERRHI